MDKRTLSERDICTKFITPALLTAGWSQQHFREEVKLTDGRVVVRGQLASRITDSRVQGGPRRADYVLYAQAHLPIAVIEAKQNKYPVGQGMQQALAYAEMLDVPFAFSSNGDGFLFHDRSGLSQPCIQELSLASLWALYQQYKGIQTPAATKLMTQAYHSSAKGKEPRYYQRIAINRTLEAIAKGHAYY